MTDLAGRQLKISLAPSHNISQKEHSTGVSVSIVCDTSCSRHDAQWNSCQYIAFCNSSQHGAVRSSCQYGTFRSSCAHPKSQCLKTGQDHTLSLRYISAGNPEGCCVCVRLPVH